MSKNTRLINSVIAAAVILFVVIVDQITKKLVVDNMSLGESIVVIKGVLQITYITNSGSAFGMLSNARWVFMILSVVGISAVAAYTFWQADKMSRTMIVLLSLISGGGIGNMIDRLFNGETFGAGVVIDFVDFIGFGELWKWIYNFADACVTVSCGLLIVVLIAGEIRRARLLKKNGQIKAGETELPEAGASEQTGTHDAGASADCDNKDEKQNRDDT